MKMINCYHNLPINNFKDYQSLESKEFFDNIFYNDLFLPDTDLWSMSRPSSLYTLETVYLFNKLLKDK